MRAVTRRRTRLLIASAAAWLALTVPVRGDLAGGARLAAAYDAILSADFERVDRLLADTCPPAPAEACLALKAASLWWQIEMDPYSRALDARLESAAAAAVGAADRWTRREPDRAEAWFYLASAHAPAVQLKVLRGDRLSAARDGRRIKNALERALALDPQLNDAFFGIGLYHYYADVAPLAAKILRVLMLLPGGDRERGLKEMLQARDRGQLLSGEADFQLHWLYLWYENQPGRGLELVSGLASKHPSNPVFLQRIAEIQHEYFHDHQASAAAWRLLVERARAGRVHAARLSEVRGRIGLAAELAELSNLTEAVDQLQTVVAMRPSAPHSARAVAHFELGALYERLGRRDRASSEYANAMAFAPDDDPFRVRRRARAALDRR